jgi:hypothetical protein
MFIMKRLLFIILSLAVFASCERKIDELTVSKGAADFSRFVAVGNSMMAGYSDGALYHSGQANSIPNLLAKQFALAGGGTFVQPVVNSEYGVDFPGSMPRLVLGYKADCKGVTGLSPIPYIGERDPVLPVGHQVNNLGIPGAKSFHMIFPGYANYNPYYARFASGMTKMVIEEIPALNPSFFAVWLGDNDVLSYALTGGVGDSITSPQFFGYAMGNVVGSLVANGSKGVLANIPDITAIPFFTTVPYNGLVLTQNQADSINMAMQLYQLPFVYTAGPNPFIIADPTSPHPYFKVRQMQPGELVLLSVPQDSLKCKGMGIIDPGNPLAGPYPIPTQYVLTLDEVTNIQTATAAYNQIIADLAVTYQLGVVDMNSNLKKIQQGIVWDGVKMNAKFISGGVFSLDGVHLNARGNAVAANYFIDAINAQYASTLPYLNITEYQGVVYP